jgi:hypothetical protein
MVVNSHDSLREDRKRAMRINNIWAINLHTGFVTYQGNAKTILLSYLHQNLKIIHP